MKIERRARIAVMAGHDRCYPYLDVVDGHDVPWGVQTRLVIAREVYEVVPGVTRIRKLSAENCDICKERPAQRGDGHEHRKRGFFYRIEISDHNGKPVSARDIRDEYFRQEYDPWTPYFVREPFPLATDEEWGMGLPIAPDLRTADWRRAAERDTLRRMLAEDNKDRLPLHARAYRWSLDDMDRRDMMRMHGGGIVTMPLRDFQALCVRKGAADVALAAAMFGKSLNQHHLDYDWEKWWWETQYQFQSHRQFGDFPEFRDHREPGVLSLYYEADGSVRVQQHNRHWRRLMERNQEVAEMVAMKQHGLDLQEQVRRMARRERLLREQGLHTGEIIPASRFDWDSYRTTVVRRAAVTLRKAA